MFLTVRFSRLLDEPRETRRLLERTLLLVVAAEAILGRLVVKGLEKKPHVVKGVPETIVPPTWFVLADYLALFLLYFATVLAVLTLVVGRLESRRGWSHARPLHQLDLGAGWLIGFVLTVAIVYAATIDPGSVQWLLLGGLAALALHRVIAAIARRVGVAGTLGLVFAAAPVVIYCVAGLASRRLWNEQEIFDGEPRAWLGAWGRGTLVLAALVSPYLLGPRPFARSMTRVVPFAVALGIASIGAAALRLDYLATVRALNRVLGLDLDPAGAQDTIALYLLAFATMAWTIAACLGAPSPARRRIGIGLALLVVAGYGFAWPMSFAVAAVGLIAVAEGVGAVRAEERAAEGPRTPPIDDDFWQAYVGQVVAALRAGGHEVSAVSVRGEQAQTSTVILTERHGVPVRTRIERQAGCVVVLDVICGRETSRVPTWTALARRAGHGPHPEPPPAGPPMRADDEPFDQVFRCRGNRDAMLAAIDPGLRARLAATADGWIAGWTRESVRHRVFPGQGAPLDHPLPISDLASRRPVSPAVVERLVARIVLCAEIAQRLGAGGDPQVLEPAREEPAPEEPAA